LKTIDYLFPRYLYQHSKELDLFAAHEKKRANISEKMWAALESTYGSASKSQGIFSYVYAILFAPTYRRKYVEFLRADFPRLPITTDAKLFQRLLAIGEKLVDLHLLKSPALDPPSCRFSGTGDTKVASSASQGFNFDPPKKRVYINNTQFFDGITQDQWDYQIGGYAVLPQWLKYRKDRTLSTAEIKNFCLIATALEKTIVLQSEIDDLYPKVEKDIIPWTES
jgi:predicted helicase